MNDEITDDELLHFMKEQFDNVCFGDLEYLEGTCLSIFAQAIRAGYRGFQKTEGRQEYEQFDKVTVRNTRYILKLRKFVLGVKVDYGLRDESISTDCGKAGENIQDMSILQ